MLRARTPLQRPPSAAPPPPPFPPRGRNSAKLRLRGGRAGEGKGGGGRAGRACRRSASRRMRSGAVAGRAGQERRRVNSRGERRGGLGGVSGRSAGPPARVLVLPPTCPAGGRRRRRRRLRRRLPRPAPPERPREERGGRGALVVPALHPLPPGSSPAGRRVTALRR